jgi:hypothetical protein
MSQNPQIPTIVNSRAVMSHVEMMIADTLSTVGARKLKELGLVAPSYSGDMSLSHSETLSRKVCAKLVDVLQKAVQKSLPFLEYAQAITKDKVSLFIPVDRDGRLGLARYARYINYLCRKNGVPISADFAGVSTVDEQQADRVGEWNPPLAPYSLSYDRLRISLVLWYVDNLEDNSRELITLENGDFTIPSDDAFEKLVSKTFNTQYGVGWSTAHGYSSARISGSVRGYQSPDPRILRLQAMERIFFFLPEALKVLRTLSRKVAYDYRAYSLSPSGDE